MIDLHSHFRDEASIDIEVDGLRIAYELAGEGPTVVAWGAPGTGRSSDPPESFRLPDYADCLADFVDGLAGAYAGWSGSLVDVTIAVVARRIAGTGGDSDERGRTCASEYDAGATRRDGPSAPRLRRPAAHPGS
jgi:hypothetical protein